MLYIDLMKKNLKSQKWPQNHLSSPKNIHKIFKLPKYSFFYTPSPPPPQKKNIFIEIQEFESKQ